tara:strand:+ start:1122 stop:1460 length:339 start_codon:yes stop_codon:yes gene_type:complete
MKNKRFKKLDTFKHGTVIGLIFPIIGFFISFLVNGSEMSLESYWQFFTKSSDSTLDSTRHIYTDSRQSTLVFCLLPNLLLFYFSFFQYKLDQFSKGLVGTTLILAALTFIFI